MELEGGHRVNVDEGGDGANDGSLHGVGVDVEEGVGGANEGRLHGVMIMGFFLKISGSHFQMKFSLHLNPGNSGYISFYGTTGISKTVW